MVEENCGFASYCGSKGETCALKSTLIHQSEAGGPDTDAGSVWHREIWSMFADRTIVAAETKGCLLGAEISALVEHITREKERKGELR